MDGHLEHSQIADIIYHARTNALQRNHERFPHWTTDGHGNDLHNEVQSAIFALTLEIASNYATKCDGVDGFDRAVFMNCALSTR